jgi:hypothetical protein
MKRLIITLTLALSLISFSSFANGDDVAPAAIKSFNSAFKTATEVSWSKSQAFYRANFSLNGQFVSAFYDAEGKMIAVTRNISSLQLPITLQASLKNGYKGFWITDLVEMANEDGTSYYLTLENADVKLVLKSNITGTWSTYKKQRKS